ncbi:hypothetical protein LMTR3_14155 [Bradyrhizobium sp. LMTR 3]|nr:hypothetical protein LMTR3_14155 [Bradyrhizobium sp. LMTR 3]
MSAATLATHLSCSRQYIGKLVTADVIKALPGGGFDLDECRSRYIKRLREQRAQSARSAADVEFTKAKTELLRLKVGEKTGSLIKFDDHLNIVDEMCGVMRTCLSGLPARAAGSDLLLRRRIEGVIHECLHEIADVAGRKADELRAQEGADVDDAA